MRYYFTPVKIAIIKKNPQTTNAGEDVKKMEPSCTVCGDVNWYTYYGEQYGGRFLKKTKNRTTMCPCNSTPGQIYREKDDLKKIHASQCSLQHCLQ